MPGLRDLLFLSALCVSAVASAESPRMTVRPADEGRPLNNPGMGFVMHWFDNSLTNYGARLPSGDDMAWFPGCRVCYFRLPWSAIEPAEGHYDWSAIDAVAQRWIDRGGQIAFRVTCSETGFEYATPKWVFDAGARGVRYDYGWGDRGGVKADGRLVDPVYDDPVFLAKLDAFLGRFAARYDGDPAVAFVDIGTFGTWGEGHVGGASRPPEGAIPALVKRHIDLHLRHFRRTQLVISDDVSGNGDGCMTDLLDYARAHGVGWRDDSILVERAPHEWYHAQQAAAYWRDLPVVLEHEHYALSQKAGAWNARRLLDAVEEHHASYLSVHGDARAILAENRPWIDRINARLGYRYRPVEISWPTAVAADARFFTILWKWTNAGVAPAYADHYPAISLKDAEGRIAAVWTAEKLNLRHLPVGAADAPHVVSGWFDVFLTPSAFPAPKGKFALYLSAGRADGTPTIELPLPPETDDGHHRYRLGEIEFSKVDAGR